MSLSLHRLPPPRRSNEALDEPLTSKTHRGVRSSHRSRMVTNAWFGAVAAEQGLRDQFLRECATLERVT